MNKRLLVFAVAATGLMVACTSTAGVQRPLAASAPRGSAAPPLTGIHKI
jgi:hypothetical protein